MALPDESVAEHLFKSGDHLVGYSSQWPLQMQISFWTGITLEPLHLEEQVLIGSFHAQQRPSALILPPANGRFANPSVDGLHLALSGGGEHGCGIEKTDDGIKITDGIVPVLLLSSGKGQKPSTMPKKLADVRDWFLSL